MLDEIKIKELFGENGEKELSGELVFGYSGYDLINGDSSVNFGYGHKKIFSLKTVEDNKYVHMSFNFPRKNEDLEKKIREHVYLLKKYPFLIAHITKFKEDEETNENNLLKKPFSYLNKYLQQSVLFMYTNSLYIYENEGAFFVGLNIAFWYDCPFANLHKASSISTDADTLMEEFLKFIDIISEKFHLLTKDSRKYDLE